MRHALFSLFFLSRKIIDGELDFINVLIVAFNTVKVVSANICIG